MDSTNSEALRRAEEGEFVVVADRQLAGRGRWGRSWVCPAGAGLLCSISVRPRLSPEDSFVLPLAASLAVARAVRGYGLEAQVRWPNDVYLWGRKLCGVLVELRVKGARVHQAVVGMGVNLAPVGVPHAISLQEALGRKPPPREVLERVLGEFEPLLELAESGRAGQVVQAWSRLHMLPGRTVELSLPEGRVLAEVEGVDERGRLVVRCRGRVRRLAEGEVSAVLEAPQTGDQRG